MAGSRDSVAAYGRVARHFCDVRAACHARMAGGPWPLRGCRVRLLETASVSILVVPSERARMKHVPNALTIARIVVTPVMLILLLSDTLLGIAGALGLFILAAVSDYLDGKIARDYKVRSRIGQFLDPLADKVLVLGTFIVLAVMVPEIVPWWGVVLIALRDASVTALRSWAESKGRSLRTLPIAKAKTAVQITFLILMLILLTAEKLQDELGEAAAWVLDSVLAYATFLLVVAFTVGTGLIYFLKQESNP